MEVYVLTVTWQFDSGECGNYVHVYDSFEKAQKQMEYEINLARKDFKNADIDAEEHNYLKGDMAWSIWETENYCYNHCDIMIYQKEIE